MKEKLLLLIAVLALALSGCSTASESTNPPSASVDAETVDPAAADQKFSQQVFAMDTYMALEAYGPNAQEALKTAAGQLTELDALLSATAEGSEIYALNHGNGEATAVSQATLELLTQAIQLGESTGGALDVSIYPVVKAWGFTTGEYRIPDQAELDELLTQVDASQITVDEANSTVTLPQGMEIDLGSMAKGYAGNLLTDTLKEAGVTSALLNLGGSTIRAVGSKPDGSDWRIAVQDPEDSSAYAGVLSVSDCIIDTSGGYERYFEGEDGQIYWHIIDPSTGCPSDSGLISTTVICEDGALGDGLSTATFVMGLDRAVEYWKENGDFEFVFITDDHQIYVSQGIADCFTPCGSYEDASVTVVER